MTNQWQNRIGKTTISMALAAWTLAGVGMGAQDYVVDTFDGPDSESQWVRWWGSAPQQYVFDGTQDAGQSPTSGALMAIVNFDLAQYGGDNQFALRGDFPNGEVVDGRPYTKLVFDLRWDAQSPKRSPGDYGYLDVGFRLPDWSQLWLGGLTITEDFANQWKHVELPIDPAATQLDRLQGVVLKMWAGGDNGLTGETVFWLDNVKLIASSHPEIPPPTLALDRPVTGLSLTASALNQQWQRQSIRTVLNTDDGGQRLLSWVGNTTPVTYRFILKDFPGPEFAGFQAHLFLIPETGLPYGPDDTSVDWNAPHVVFFQVTATEEGEGVGRFMYKVNEPSGNSMLWNTNAAAGPVGTLLILTNSTPVGSWTVTFSDNTHVQVTAPDGTQGQAEMPADDVAYFSNPLYAYFGIQPNGEDRIGLAAVLGSAAITGLPDGFTDEFTGSELDATRWKIVAADPAGIALVPPDTLWRVAWSLPDTGFQLQVSPSVAPGDWRPLDTSGAAQGAGRRMLFLQPDDLPSGGAAFFRMVKPEGP